MITETESPAPPRPLTPDEWQANYLSLLSRFDTDFDAQSKAKSLHPNCDLHVAEVRACRQALASVVPLEEIERLKGDSETAREELRAAQRAWEKADAARDAAKEKYDAVDVAIVRAAKSRTVCLRRQWAFLDLPIWRLFSRDLEAAGFVVLDGGALLEKTDPLAQGRVQMPHECSACWRKPNPPAVECYANDGDRACFRCGCGNTWSASSTHVKAKVGVVRGILNKLGR